ncbi:hypothetical protein ACFLVJ_00820 [Chloroflexota bacterium]
MFKNKLQYSIILLVFGILLIIGIIGGAAMLYFQQQSLQANFRESTITLAAMLRDSLERDMLLADQEHVQQTVVLLASRELVSDVTVLSDERRVYVSSEVSLIGQVRDNETIERAFASGEAVTRNANYNGKENLYVVLPIFNKPDCYGCHGSEQKIRGVVEIGVDRIFLDKQVREQTLVMLIIAGVTFMVLGGRTNLCVSVNSGQADVKTYRFNP